MDKVGPLYSEEASIGLDIIISIGVDKTGPSVRPTESAASGGGLVGSVFSVHPPCLHWAFFSFHALQEEEMQMGRKC